MSKPRFLLDENMPHALREALRRVEPAVDVRVMGEVGCPPLETEDLELLAWIERENRKGSCSTMPTWLRRNSRG